jgi:hypothetical protein
MALLKTFPLDPDAGYGFEWLRAMLEVSPLQEGVVGAGDFKVTPAAAGGNRVDVAAGMALVKGDSGLPALGITQGLYLQGNDAAIANALTFDVGGAQPRLDQVILIVSDTSDLGSASNAPSLAIVKGAEVAGTTLDNAYTNGSAGALPANAIRLADRLVPAGASTVNAVDVRDRRRRARGARAWAKRTAGNVVTASSVYSEADSNMRQRVELSGAPVRLRAWGLFENNGGGNRQNGLAFYDAPNGAAINAAVNADASPLNELQKVQAASPASVLADSFDFTDSWTPVAGTHLIALYIRAIAGTVTFYGTAGNPLNFELEERPGDLGNNN